MHATTQHAQSHQGNSTQRNWSAAVPWTPAGQAWHMLGAGGCGMSGVARMLRERGAAVSGADMRDSPVVRALRKEGVGVEIAQEGTLPDACDGVVASAAIRPDHPQLLEAQRRGVPVMTYAEALGKSMLGRTGVAVAGTHGKSTTTAMLGWALVHAGMDPTVIVGATCAQLAGEGKPASGFRLGTQEIPAGAWEGKPGLLLAEACEFNRSFHTLRPTVASVSAIEADHLDIYGSLDEVVEAFAGFAATIDPDGLLLIGHEGAHRRVLAAAALCRVETLGFSPAADWHAELDPAEGRMTLRRKGETVTAWKPPMPGAHNAENSAFAAAMAVSVGADPHAVGEALGSFAGLQRRTQLVGERGGVRVYDDYGHHPTEIDATLRALRETERPDERGGRLLCVFQPHQHSRTRFLLREFASSFDAADEVIVPHIYFVRDSEIEKTRVGAADLVDELRRRGVRAMHLYPFDAIVEQLQAVCRPGDLLVVMGAGPVGAIAHDFVKGA